MQTERHTGGWCPSFPFPFLTCFSEIQIFFTDTWEKREPEPLLILPSVIRPDYQALETQHAASFSGKHVQEVQK
jgi:hypothetical protein